MSSHPISIRAAEAKDVDWIVHQLRHFSRFFGTKRQLFEDPEFARQGMLTMMRDHVVIVADHKDKGLVGFISGYVLPHPFNPTIRLLSETFWWVDEEHRGGRAGLLLLEEFLAWGKQNTDWITFALEEKSPVKEDCLTRRGFHLHERSYLMEVN